MPEVSNYNIRDLQQKIRDKADKLGNPSVLDWRTLIKEVYAKKATDLLIAPNGIRLRIDRDLTVVQPAPNNVDEYIEALVSTLPSQHHLNQLLSPSGATDFAVVFPTDEQARTRRFRGNIFFTNNGLSGSFRPLPSEIIPVRNLGIDPINLSTFLKLKEGLVIVAGPTGSGKSTTLASLIEEINKSNPCHIITIEDPIEFVFTERKATFSQREVGSHVDSFATGLRSAMRENPDIIFVGEIRDYATALCALQAAESGHLVLATLHTRRAHTTINRMVAWAADEEKANFRTSLAQNTAMIMCQRLLKRVGGGIIACREVLLGQVAAIQTAITNGREREEIPNLLTTNRALGMIDWNSALQKLERENLITPQEAERYREKN